MKKNLLPILLITVGAIVITSCATIKGAKKSDQSDWDHDKKKYSVLYFSPEVYPNIPEIQGPSNFAFFSAVSDKVARNRQIKMDKVDSTMPFDDVDVDAIKEMCKNNGSDLVVVPRIKYFKVGFGKYVFSNQVVVSMKVYNAKGQLLKETSYDTFRKNKRMIGNTENSIKIGTVGAMNDIMKEIKDFDKMKVMLANQGETRIAEQVSFIE